MLSQAIADSAPERALMGASTALSVAVVVGFIVSGALVLSAQSLFRVGDGLKIRARVRVELHTQA